MGKIIYGQSRPTEEDIEWFSKHVGPRTHWLVDSVGGKGWVFDMQYEPGTKDHSDRPNWLRKQSWYLTVEDDKMLMYWTLMR
jgi:hypothetical protein